MQSQLLARTQQLVRERPPSLTLRHIARDTGLSYGWLKLFVREIPDHSPGVCEVEALYTYLSGKRLDIE